VPLRTEQHILHLLLTLCAFGLWGFVWAGRASTGNRVLNMAPPDWKPPPVEQRRPGTAPGG